jgi:hypothetical protein
MTTGWINLGLHTQCGMFNAWPKIGASRPDKLIMAYRWERNQITLA